MNWAESALSTASIMASAIRGKVFFRRSSRETTRAADGALASMMWLLRSPVLRTVSRDDGRKPDGLRQRRADWW